MRTLIRCGTALLVISHLAAATPAARGEESPVTAKSSKMQLSGVGWLTYRYILSDEEAGTVPGSVLSGQDHSSFDVDRVYANADYAVSDRYRFRTTLEATNVAGSLDFFLKRAYLEVEEPFRLARTTLRFGQIPNGMTGVVEKAWGYRIVSKVPIDRYLGVSTTWVGAGISGRPAGGQVDWDLVVANEKSFSKPSSGRYKSFQGRITVAPLREGKAASAKLAVFGQYQAKEAPAGLPDDAAENNDLYFGVFPHLQSGRTTAGLEFIRRIDKHSTPAKGGDSETVTAQCISGFARIRAGERLELFGRLDLVDPDTDADSDGYTVVIGGLSHRYAPEIRSILDLEYAVWQEPAGASYDPEVTLAARVEVSF